MGNPANDLADKVWPIGEYGQAEVEVTKDLKLKVSVGVEVDLIGEIEKLAAKSSTPIFQEAIDWVKGLISKAPAS